MRDNNNPFLNLIYALHFSAMQGMGKIKNPLTDKIERNLAHAKESIDMLLLLRDKTKGNLTADEEKILTGIISEVQINYVDESQKDKNITIN
jgi:Domain of unknown function (DUF1844)